MNYSHTRRGVGITGVEENLFSSPVTEFIVFPKKQLLSQVFIPGFSFPAGFRTLPGAEFA